MSERTDFHEAAHCAVAVRCGWTVLAASVLPGQCAGGWTNILAPPSSWPEFDASLPFVLWPGAARWSLEAETLVVLAGGLAEESWRPGRVAEPLVVRAAELAEAAALLPAELRDQAEVAANDPDTEQDEERLARLMRSAHGGDVASAAAHLVLLDQQARRIVAMEERRISLLARSLSVYGVLDRDQVATVLGAALRDTARAPDGRGLGDLPLPGGAAPEREAGTGGIARPG
jgi:hypothetical protein